nr:EVE domain-containing protein [Gammaproteobacteria bacterium]
MQYWLMKSEPNDFSIDDLQARPQQREPWDGVRNYQARNVMRDEMKSGDLAFFYYSSCALPGIVGIVKVVRNGYPDSTAFDPRSRHYDPKSDPANPRWYQVDVEFVRKLQRPIPLLELKNHPQLAEMPLLRRGNRLSIMPVAEADWHFILALENR